MTPGGTMIGAPQTPDRQQQLETAAVLPGHARPMVEVAHV